MDRKPNILIFMTDQQRGDPLKDGRVIAPNIRRLRREGVSFGNAFCPSPHCCPSRATFMSGLYPSGHGVWNNVNVGNALSRGLKTGIRLWSEDIRDAGYRLHYSGKWHVSSVESPSDRGWEEGVVTAGARHKNNPPPDDFEWKSYEKQPPLPSASADARIQRSGYGTYTQYGVDKDVFNDQAVVEDAEQFLATAGKDTPWCLFAGTLGPHDPYFVPREFLDMYNPADIELPSNFYDEMADKPALYRRTRDRFSQLTPRSHRESIRHYLAFCSYQDALFGRVMAALERRGDAGNTLVVFTSDHGDYMAEHGLWCKGLPCFRGAYDIPLLMRWPAGIVRPGRKEDAFVSLADFAPTVLEIAGIETGRRFAGESLMPFLADNQPVAWRDTVFTQSNGNELYGIQRAAITRDWKFIYNGYDYDELYDLSSDPGETVNLIGRPELDGVVREMSRRLWRFARENRDNCINGYIMTALARYGPGIAFE